MKIRNFREIGKLVAGRARRWACLAAVVVALVGAVSCSTVRRTVVQLPMVPGASYVGSKECEQCHEEIYRGFIGTADHARLMTPGPNAVEAGCEACHGPASLHAESGGEVKTAYGFSAGRPAVNGFGAAVALHGARSKDTACFQCHADVRGQFSLPSHHPLPEGKLNCVDCHPPHKGSSHLGGGAALLTQNQGCLSCHPSQRGPHVFEHEAVREGCTVCHTAHGSVNPKLLTARDANLCYKCHFQRVSGGQLLIGDSDHTLRVQQGTCWTAGCHEAVHGSRVSSSLRF